MAGQNNPIRYSDLITPDDSITNLIKQLQELSGAYSNAIKDIKSEATQLTTALNGVSGATDEGRKATRKAAEDADRLAKAQRDLKFAQSETAEELARLKAAQKEANSITRLVVKLNDSAEGSYNRLSAQYAINKMRINKMSQAERDAAEARTGLITKTRELYEEMKRQQKETGKNQLNVGNYTEASDAIIAYADNLKNALGINNTFGESLLKLGRGGSEGKAVFTAMADGAKALGNTLLGLLKNPAFVAIAGVTGVGAAFKWWYDYNLGLVEATRLTQQFTGKSGEDLKAFRNQVQAVADTFNVDFKETLIAANALSKQFGISSNEALQLVQDGFVAGGNANGEFIDTVKEYPAYFREAGISAEQFVAIVAETNKAGIFSDKGVDAIKEANLRIREMTTATAAALDGIGISSAQVREELESGMTTTFEVMQRVSQKLNELPASSAAVGTAIADIFGGPGEDAGLQYLQTLKDISTNLDDVKSKAGILGQLQEQQLQSQLNLQNALSGLFDLTGGNFETMTTRLKVFVNDSLAALIRGVISIANYLIEFYNNSLLLRGTWQTIVVTFKNAFDTIGNLFAYFLDLIKAVGTTIKGAFTLDWDEFKRGLSGFTTALPNLIKATMKDAKENFKEGVDAMRREVKPIEIPVTVTGADKVVEAVKEVVKAGKGRTIIDQIVPPQQLINRSVEMVKKPIETIKQEINSLAKEQQERGTDIYSLFGLKLNDDTKAGIDTSMQYAMDALNTYVDEWVSAADRKVEAADREVDSAQNVLNAELAARASGYANNVIMAQKELDLAKRNQEKALREQQKAQRAQAAMQTIQQAGNLVSASALIWAQLGFPWAIPALAVMWGSFAASKIKAAQVTRQGATEAYGEGTVELLSGGSHQSGNDVDLGRKADGTRRRAEGGEFFAVINKRNSRKYRKYIPSVINSLNNGTFESKYLNAYQGGEGLIISVNNESRDLRTITDDVREIKEQNRTRVYVDGTGNTVETYKNLKRKIKR